MTRHSPGGILLNQMGEYRYARCAGAGRPARPIQRKLGKLWGPAPTKVYPVPDRRALLGAASGNDGRTALSTSAGTGHTPAAMTATRRRRQLSALDIGEGFLC